MRVVFLRPPHGDVIARELIDAEAEGSFLLRAGRVLYSHPSTGTLFAAPSLAVFQNAAQAWETYRERVGAEPEEAAQLRVVAVLREDLERCGVLADEGFWSLILEQAEDGLL